MTSRPLLRRLKLLVLAGAFLTRSVFGHDYPTNERVEFVLECMREHLGPAFEMVQKCSCALDRIAEQLSFDDFITASTLAKAVSIAGERGSALRNNENAQADAGRFRSLYDRVRTKCMFRR